MVIFVLWIAFIPLEQKINLNLLKFCKHEDFCGVVMPSEKEIILEFNQYMKSDKMSYIIYADIESLTKKIDECANNPQNSSATKIAKYNPCWYSMSTVWAFKIIENKNTLYRGKYCMKKFCESLREHAKNIIHFEKKKNVTINRRRIKITSRCKKLFVFKEKGS